MKKSKNTVTFYRNPLILIWIMGLLHLLFVWPGDLSPDSHAQYQMALTGVYGDHHPPMMSFLWRYLDRILKGPGLLLCLHFSWFYGAIYFLIKNFPKTRARFLFFVLPLIPPVLAYASGIWKDIGFAFSFLYCAAYLSYLTSTQKKFQGYQVLIILISLFYGTAVKFQAQYCAPILLSWIAYIWAGYQLNFRRWLPIVSVLCLIFYVCLNGFNNALVPVAQKNHAWQYVKIFDLAAIQIESGEEVLPYFTHNPNYNQNLFQKQFNSHGIAPRVDDLVFGLEPILRKGENEKESRILYDAWVKGVLHHPFIYLKHRLRNTLCILLSRPGFSEVPGLLARITTPETPLYYTLYHAIGLASYVIMSHLHAAILCLFYCFLSLKTLRKTWEAIPLLGFNAIGLMMLSVLFFCSMAGTPRYTYIVVCMVHASHVFAYRCYLTFQKSYKRLRSTC